MGEAAAPAACDVDTEPFLLPLEEDPEGVGDVLDVLQARADEVRPAMLRPIVGKTEKQRRAAEQFIDEVARAKCLEGIRELTRPLIRGFDQEKQLEEIIEAADQRLASRQDGPFVVCRLLSEKPKPRTPIFYAAWVTLNNRKDTVTIRDGTCKGRHAAELVLHRR